MATQDELHSLAGKALAEPDFRKKLMDDPEEAIKETGVELTPEQMQALKQMDKNQLDAELTELEQRLSMCSPGCWGFHPERYGDHDVLTNWEES